MLINGTPNPPQCFNVNSPLSDGIYLGHSMIPADVDGTTAPPAGRDEYMVSIENPVINNTASTSSTFNLWDFHVNWSNPALTTFTQSAVFSGTLHSGCYDVLSPVQTVCVPEPSTSTTKEYIDFRGRPLLCRGLLTATSAPTNRFYSAMMCPSVRAARRLEFAGMKCVELALLRFIRMAQ